jgi:hypothetical protein
VGRIKKTGSPTGTGIFLHRGKAMDVKDTTVMRPNFDTQYSFAILDLTEPATLTMPETNGRYQSAWIITEEHYNPTAYVKPGTYSITEENMGSKYVMIVARTQVNMTDPEDRNIALSLQKQLKLEQKRPGNYTASHKWHMNEILTMRKKYQAIVVEKKISSEMMFGKKGEVSLENHNAGTAYGWGGLTKERAVYPAYSPENNGTYKLSLKNVPCRAFWSVTVYNSDGYISSENYNINSAFTELEEDGSYVINFGTDSTSKNYLDTFDGWNFVLRIYEPTELYLSGDWEKPVLKEVSKD